MRKYIPQLFVSLVVLYMLFLIRPALLGQLTGTFKPHTVPADYIKLEEFLNTQEKFSRTFWIPAPQRFGFYSAKHPAVSSEDFYHVASISGVLDNLEKEGAEKQLQEASVKYVVVPFDSEGEIFLKDRKYDEATYLKTVDNVGKVSWLSEVPGFGRIHVFEVKNPKDHFWTESPLRLSYTFINPTEYKVTVENAQKGDRVIFAESYDSGWKAYLSQTENSKVESMPYKKTFNSFILPQSGDYTMKVFYQPQKWVNVGLWISGITLVVCLIFLVISGYSWFWKRKMVE